MTILVSPWARPTSDGKPSPKNYPHWEPLCKDLLAKGHEVLQLSMPGEQGVPCTKRIDKLPLAQIGALMKSCATWVSVDNFFHHMAWHLGEPGVVLFGLSDPTIFGHPQNLNLLKDRRFLRVHQFRFWSQEEPNPESFVDPHDVLRAIDASVVQRKLSRKE